MKTKAIKWGAVGAVLLVIIIAIAIRARIQTMEVWPDYGKSGNGAFRVKA